jgi:glycosyltransferase involved in cell wall biosynthesis
VFVGSMDYMPNIQGVLWLANEVWPTIRSQFPSARLQIVGRRPVASVRALAHRHNGIEVIGEVADVQPHLRQATVAVAPMWIARGVQNKVLEAMAVSRPVLVSPEVAGGIGAEEQQEMIVAGSVDQWIDGLTRLFTDRALRQQLGWAGRKFVQTYHRWSVCLAPLAAALAGCTVQELEGVQANVRAPAHEPSRQAA